MVEDAQPSNVLNCPNCGRADMVSAVSAIYSTQQYYGPGQALRTPLVQQLSPRPEPFPLTEPANCLSAVTFFVAFPVWIAWFIAIAVKASNRNKRVEQGLAAALAVWSEAWYCQRCGGVYFPARSISLPPNVPQGQLITPLEFRCFVWTAGGYLDLLSL